MASDAADISSASQAEPASPPKVKEGSPEWNSLLKPYFLKFGDGSKLWVDLYKATDLSKTFLTKASTDIPAGTRIFLDYPLLFVDPDLEPVLEATNIVKLQVECLDNYGKSLFYSLPNFFQGKYSKPFSICRSWSLPLVTSQRHIATPTNPEHQPTVCLADNPSRPFQGVFPHLAKFVRHSCAPNAVARVTDDEKHGICLAVRTCRPVMKGEIMTIDWLGSNSVYTDRQDLHMNKFGYPCTCPKCLASSQTDAVRATSDEQRQRLARLVNQIRGGAPLTLLRTLRRLQQVLDICMTENIYDETLADIYFAAYKAMLNNNDKVRALEFFFRYQEHMFILLGQDSLLLKKEEIAALGNPLGAEAYAGHIKITVSMTNDGQFEAWLFRTHEQISRLDLLKSYADLQDDTIFRGFWLLPSSTMLTDDWVDGEGQPVRHWALFAETVAVSDPIGLNVLAKDKVGAQFTICLKKLREQGTLSSIYVSRGSLAIMLYVTRQELESGQVGVQPQSQDHTFVRGTLPPPIIASFLATILTVAFPN